MVSPDPSSAVRTQVSGRAGSGLRHAARWSGKRFRTLREWLRTLEFTLARRFGLAPREDRLFLLSIGFVGVVAGLLGLCTEYLIGGLQRLLWGSSADLITVARTVPRWLVVAAPAAGGALVGLVTWAGRQAVTGEGMASLIEAVALYGGKIPAKPVLFNALTAIATVGSGGSLGREGPMIRLGA